MASPLRGPVSPPAPVPIAPTEEAWRAMSAAERERFLIQVNDALSDPLVTMSEGRPHKKAKSRAVDMLGLHFKAMGRAIYLAEEMSAVYPGVKVFTPDVFAVVDVAQPEDDERMAWVVADEAGGSTSRSRCSTAGTARRISRTTSSSTRASGSRSTSSTTGASSRSTAIASR